MLLSVASIWEMAVKCSIGKLVIPDPLTIVPAWVELLKIQVLAFEQSHAYATYGLPMLHKDPFDRMLIAQAMVEDLVLVTNDENIHRYDVRWTW